MLHKIFKKLLKKNLELHLLGSHLNFLDLQTWDDCKVDHKIVELIEVGLEA